jgi:SEC-C motif-containing protein
VLDGRPAESPEALMRSRYTAYATGAVDHVMATTAPESPHRGADPSAWRAELRAWCAAVSFDGLEVREAHTDGDRGTVTFFARLRSGDRDVSFGERSRFVRRDGRWWYVDGDRV